MGTTSFYPIFFSTVPTVVLDNFWPARLRDPRETPAAISTGPALLPASRCESTRTIPSHASATNCGAGNELNSFSALRIRICSLLNLAQETNGFGRKLTKNIAVADLRFTTLSLQSFPSCGARQDTADLDGPLIVESVLDTQDPNDYSQFVDPIGLRNPG